MVTPVPAQNPQVADLRAAIAALEGQRATLGDAVLELATAPLRQRLAALLRPAGLQHRQVTVLFADVVGSTHIASGLDAEDTLNLLNDTLRRMATLIEAHQGRVLRFTGDGVKAAFGMDETREDDAERAVRAGLAIVQAGQAQAQVALQAHGIADFAVRVGVHTGDVALGAGVEADNTAMGAAVNIAARMEQSAPPGTLRISHDTWNHVRGLFEAEAQPPLAVKGVAAPMQTYLVRTALNRDLAGVVRGLQGLDTPLVGREAELQRLRQTLAGARQTRHLQALTVLGDAGMGKSRLLREAAAALGREPGGCRVLAVRAQPDGQLRPWGLLRSLLSVQCGVADTDSAETACRKVEEGLSPCFDEHGQRQAQLMGQLSGLDFGDSPHVRGLAPRALRDQALAALRAYLRALAGRDGALLLLVVEDLHWADEGSLDLLQHLLAFAAELPLALLMSARPALLARRPAWGPPETLVHLGPLPAAPAAALAAALLQRLQPVSPRLSELLVGRAEGNPYYMEELVRRLIDDGVITPGEPHWTVQAGRLDGLRLPGTLVGLLQARLDALPAPERQAARQASIIGHVFWDEALQALDTRAPQALPALQRAAFVRSQTGSDFEGTPQRQFDHHLLHQVTYDTLLKPERRQGHGAVLRWLSARTRGRGAEFLAMTGEHAERAGEVALAVDCFEEAGIQAQSRYANAAAVLWLRRSLGLLGETESERRCRLLMRLSTIADVQGDREAQQAAHEETARILAHEPNDPVLAQLLFARALLADRRSDREATERLSHQAFEVAERCGAAQWAAMAQANLAWLRVSFHGGAGADRHLEIGLAWAARIPKERSRNETEAQLLNMSGMVSTRLSRLHDARRALMAVLARGEALSSPRLQLGALDNLSEISETLGRWEESAAWAGRALALAQLTGAPFAAALAGLRLAVAGAAQQAPAFGLDRYAQVLASFRSLQDRRMQAVTLQFQAALQLEQGEVQAALQNNTLALALHQHLEEPVLAGEVAGGQALCQLRLGRPEEAMQTVQALLLRLGPGQDLAEQAAHDTLALRWACQQVLAALGDVRARPLLEQLHADLQVRAAQLTDEADRERLVQALPVFRGIVAAYAVLQAAARTPPRCAPPAA